MTEHFHSLPTVESGNDSQSYSAHDLGTGKLGMWIFLISLSILFAAGLIAYLIIFNRAEEWLPKGVSFPTFGLWIGTIILLVSSVSIHWGLVSVRRNQLASLKTAMLLTTLFGYGFLICQAVNWFNLRTAFLKAYIPAGKSLFEFGFYTLTGLHAIHVVGGLILLWVVTTKAFKGRYSVEYYPGVLYSVMYWHFLDAVWIVLFVVLVVSV